MDITMVTSLYKSGLNARHDKQCDMQMSDRCCHQHGEGGVMRPLSPDQQRHDTRANVSKKERKVSALNELIIHVLN